MPDNGKTCTVTFFYVFDLAEFFSKGENSIEFLNSRTDKRFHQLFSYKNEGKKNDPSDVKNLTNVGPFTYCKKEWEKEGKAYLAGWVRLNLLHQFFHPTYKFDNDNKESTYPQGFWILQCTNKIEALLESTEKDKDVLKRVKDIYKCHWYDVIKEKDSITHLLNNLKLYLSASRYGIISLRIESIIPINPVGTLNGNEFVQAKEIVSKLLNCPQSKCSESFRDEINTTVDKNLPRIPDYHPSLLDFVALIAVWNFLNELKSKTYPFHCCYLWEWSMRVGKFKDFSTIWNKCLSGQFDISHELSYFYFQSSFYKDISAYPERFIDNMCLLGRFVFSASEENEDIHFSPSVLERVKQEELSITDNGTAHIFAGTSLIVTVAKQSYKLQGMTLNEKEFWDWMFRLLCCLRECFVLAGICSTDLRKLNKNYEIFPADKFSIISALLQLLKFGAPFTLIPLIVLFQLLGKYCNAKKLIFLLLLILLITAIAFCRKWREFNMLKINMTKLSSILFTIEESINSITSSKMPAVQDKLQIFTERMGLNSLIENLNKRRASIEARISQYETERIGKISIYVAIIALLIALASLSHDISADGDSKNNDPQKASCRIYSLYF